MGELRWHKKMKLRTAELLCFILCGKKKIIISVNLGSVSPVLCYHTAEVTDILCKEIKGFFTPLSPWNSHNCFHQSKKHSKSFTNNRFSLYILEHTTAGTAKPCALLTHTFQGSSKISC